MEEVNKVPCWMTAYARRYKSIPHRKGMNCKLPAEKGPAQTPGRYTGKSLVRARKRGARIHRGLRIE